MTQLKKLSGEELQLLDRMAGSWDVYGPALRTKLGIQGNVTWKTAKGAQYLVRYFRDEMGVLVNRSLGRRSPETEGIFEDFRMRRESARRTVAETEATMALVGRLAKAHGLARMPVAHAEIIRAFWRNAVDDQMLLCCGASLFAFERDGQVSAPTNLIKDDELTFILDPHAEHIALDVMLDAYQEALGVTSGKIGQSGELIKLTCATGPTVALINEHWLVDKVGDLYDPDILCSALREPAFHGATIARDGLPVEIRTLDPRAFALAGYVMGEQKWTDRSRFMTTLVRQVWGFDHDQEAIFSALDPEFGFAPPKM